MMRSIEKLTTYFLPLALIVTCIGYIPKDVQAATKVPKNVTMYLQQHYRDKKPSATTFIVTPGADGANDITDLKMSPAYFFSDLSVMTLYNGACNIKCTAKRPGTGTVSFKIKNRQYKTKVTVKKYVNPARSVVIPGLTYKDDPNLAGLTDKKTDSAKITALKTIDDPKIQITARFGWKVEWVSFTDGSGSSKTKYYKKPRSKINKKIVFDRSKKITKNGDYMISVSFYNPKDDVSISVSYYIGSSYTDWYK